MSLHDKRTPITIIFSLPLVYYVCGWSLAISRKRVLPEHCSQIWWGGIKWPRRPLDYSAVSFLLLGIWKKALPVKSKFFLPTVASCLLSCVLSLPYSMCSRQIWDVYVQLCDAFMSIFSAVARHHFACFHLLHLHHFHQDRISVLFCVSCVCDTHWGI